MIQNTKLINAIRSLNFTFKKQTDRMMIYRQRGTTKRVEVRRHNWHDEEYCAILLRQAGMPEDEVAKFIAATSETVH